MTDSHKDRAITLLTERETHSISEATRCFAAAEGFSRKYGFEDEQAVNARNVAHGFMKDAAAFRWAMNALEGAEPAPDALQNSCCLSMSRERKDENSVVRLDFDIHADAEAVFEWLESIIGARQAVAKPA